MIKAMRMTSEELEELVYLLHRLDTTLLSTPEVEDAIEVVAIEVEDLLTERQGS